MSFDALLAEAVTRPGPQLIKPWLNKVHCGDAVEIMDRLPALSVDLVVTSPPYNLKNSTGNGMKDGRGGKWPNAALQEGYDNTMPHSGQATHPLGGIIYIVPFRMGLQADRSRIPDKSAYLAVEVLAVLDGRRRESVGIRLKRQTGLPDNPQEGRVVLVRPRVERSNEYVLPAAVVLHLVLVGKITEAGVEILR